MQYTQSPKISQSPVVSIKKAVSERVQQHEVPASQWPSHSKLVSNQVAQRHQTPERLEWAQSMSMLKSTSQYDMIRKAIDLDVDYGKPNTHKQVANDETTEKLIQRKQRNKDNNAAELLKIANLSGKLVELSGELQLTRASEWIHEAQAVGHLCAWLSTDALFYPPDLERNHIHLQSLITVQLRKRNDLFHACERLLRSGAFKLLIIDLGECRNLSLSTQSRLAALAKKNGSIVVFLTNKRKIQQSLGAFISMHLFSERHLIKDTTSTIRHRTRLIANKIKGARAGWKVEESYRAPLGLHSNPA